MIIEKDGTNITLPLMLKVARYVFDNSSESKAVLETTELAEDIIFSTIGHGFLRILPLMMDINPDILVELKLVMSILVHLDRTIRENGFDLSFIEEDIQLEPSSEAGSNNIITGNSKNNDKEAVDNIFDPESF